MEFDPHRDEGITYAFGSFTRVSPSNFISIQGLSMVQP
jgi:hypothetical protein